MFKLIVAVVVASILSGCTQIPVGSPDSYQPSSLMRGSQVEAATVVRVRPVMIEGQANGRDASPIATVLSSVAGAVLGARVIGNGNGRYIAGAMSGTISGVVAQQVTSSAVRQPGLEIVVKTESGRFMSITQGAQQMFAPGERVMLVSSGMDYRVTH
ncbi:outer membrane lipoprotein SlyB (plasmid) [Pararobbsia alpina]|uniref:glycine zipper 2TM domain-containing protein n=1 Tax=Pararobbsia alpina TaxID=621374 RepID=UPI0039A42A20